METVTIVATQKQFIKELSQMIDAELALMPFRSRIRFVAAEMYLQEEADE